MQMRSAGVLQVIAAAALVLIVPLAYAQNLVDGNVRVTTSDIIATDSYVSTVGPPADVLQQNEPHVAISPLDEDIVAVGANDVRTLGVSGDAWQSLSVSTDGGATWPFQQLIPGFPSDTSADGVNSPISGNRAASDPMVAFDRQGFLYYAFIAFQRTPPGRPDFDPQDTNAIAVARYLVTGGDPPVVYQNTVVVERGTVGLGRQEDKEFITVDNWTKSPFTGNVYLCWARFTGFQDHLQVARSSDQGQSWSLAEVFRGQADTNLQGCSLTVAPNGDVYVAWRSFSATGTVENPETSAIWVARSTNGGASFGPARRVTFFRDYRQSARRSPPVFRIFALTWLAADGTAAKHRVFLAWHERDPSKPAKGAEVAVWCTDNHGATWIPLARPHTDVNAHQLVPALAAGGGELSVVWYDSRSEESEFTPAGPVSGSGSGASGKGMDVFYNQRTSANCSAGWGTELKLTSQSFNPNLFGSIRAITPFIGDYIAVAATARRALAVWTDNRDIDGEANAAEDADPATNPAALINIRSRDSNVYLQRVDK